MPLFERTEIPAPQSSKPIQHSREVNGIRVNLWCLPEDGYWMLNTAIDVHPRQFAYQELAEAALLPELIARTEALLAGLRLLAEPNRTGFVPDEEELRAVVEELRAAVAVTTHSEHGWEG